VRREIGAQRPGYAFKVFGSGMVIKGTFPPQIQAVSILPATAAFDNDTDDRDGELVSSRARFGRYLALVFDADVLGGGGVADEVANPTWSKVATSSAPSLPDAVMVRQSL
jgi:hypothetical protein